MRALPPLSFYTIPSESAAVARIEKYVTVSPTTKGDRYGSRYSMLPHVHIQESSKFSGADVREGYSLFRVIISWGKGLQCG